MTITLAARKENLNNQLKILTSFELENDSNYKFMNLLRSRLNEEGIPLEIAANIVAMLDYDVSAVNEDDDYIGDIALSYAEFAGKVYKRMQETGWHRNLGPLVISKYFAKFPIKV